MKPKSATLVEGCTVFWGEFLDADEVNLSEVNSPEEALIAKDLLAHFNQEARTIANVIINLPDEMFTKSGKVIHGKLIKYMEDNFGWRPQKTNRVCHEIAMLLS